MEIFIPLAKAIFRDVKYYNKCVYIHVNVSVHVCNHFICTLGLIAIQMAIKLKWKCIFT